MKSQCSVLIETEMLKDVELLKNNNVIKSNSQIFQEGLQHVLTTTYKVELSKLKKGEKK